MEEHVVKILNIEEVTHNVKSFKIEKPEGYSFIPGHATDVSINVSGLKDEKRPFTFTSLNSSGYLEFTIKIYSDHNGITNELGKLKPGAELIIRDVWGDISYKGEGVFIAGGAGITPFISIFRELHYWKKIGSNLLIFANKTKDDIILESELRWLLGDLFINILSDEDSQGYAHGFITEEFLKTNIPALYNNYYLCGPPPMMEAVLGFLNNIGISSDLITMEKM
ncbi:MAG: FAD-binding oxidoreductase [Bacteroidales bacterium]|jgi:ferredoxin-NADP reductase